MRHGRPRFTFLAELPLARGALAFADELHRGQRRASDDAPFIIHPLEVAALLHHTGHDESLVVAAILHDTIEDTSLRADELHARFGNKVASLVAVMTEDPRIEPYAARKAALREQIAGAGVEATAVYAADKVVKVREYRAQVARDRALGGDSDRLTHYVRSLTMLELSNPEHPLVGQLRFELEALHALPPAGVSPAMPRELPEPRHPA